MSKRYELIVFDWDGTLMDSEARIVACMLRAAAELAMPIPTQAAARDIIGLGLPEAMRKLFPDADARTVGALVDAYRSHWLGNQVNAATMFGGAFDLVEGLHHAGYLLAVATGKSRHGLDKSLDESGLKGFFHTTRCADEAFSKPHPQMLLEILVDLDTHPNAAIVIGDTEYDMQMARAASVDAVGVSHGVHASDRLMAHGAMACFDDLFQLSGWLYKPTGSSKDGK
jgi:phosphoglycolate phosphatase